MQDLEILHNVFENTGFYNSARKSTPVTICGDGQFATDPAFLMHRNILIQNNIFRNCNAENALYINAAQAVRVLNNELGTRKGTAAEEGTAPGVFIDGACDVEVSGNIYPLDTTQKVQLSAKTRRIYGTDVGYALGDSVQAHFGSVYTADGCKITVTVTNISEQQQAYTLELNGDTTPGLLSEGFAFLDITLDAGESRTLYLDVSTKPSEMEPPQASGTTMLYMNSDSITGRGARDLTGEMYAQITQDDTAERTCYEMTLAWALVGKDGKAPPAGAQETSRPGKDTGRSTAAGIAFKTGKLTLNVGDTQQRILLARPDGAPVPQQVSYTSSDPSIVHVDGAGNITAVADVTATVEKSGLTAVCTITVADGSAPQEPATPQSGMPEESGEVSPTVSPEDESMTEKPASVQLHMPLFVLLAAVLAAGIGLLVWIVRRRAKK